MQSAMDDIDAITPCPAATAVETAPEHQSFTGVYDNMKSTRSTPSRSPSPLSSNGTVDSRRSSLRILEEGTEGDLEQKWKRMLALQQIYGCYKSARMSAALESGDASLSLLPSRACIDLLNDDMAQLPEDAEEVLRREPTFVDSRRTSLCKPSESSSTPHRK